jgi:hypothetical protein
LNYVVLLCIEFVILLIEEKMMSYVTVSEGHGYPLVYKIYKIHKAKWKQANNQLGQEIGQKYWGNEREEIFRPPKMNCHFGSLES